MLRTQTKKSNIEYDGNGLVTITLHEDADINLEDALEIREASYSLHLGNPHVNLVITAQRNTSSPEARKYSAQNRPPGRLAQAVLIQSLPVRLMGNFFLKFDKPNSPIRLFDKKEDALKWLEKILTEEHKKQLHSQSQM